MTNPMFPTHVSKSKKLYDGVCIWFGNKMGDDEKYYAHGIHAIGTPDDLPAGNTAWSWVNHMSHKLWWNEKLADEFWLEVFKYFKV